MPSKSPAQARLMAAAAHNPQFAKKVGVPQSVAKEFNQADQGNRLLKEGDKAKKMQGRY
jgi:hypothetical protein